MARLKQAPKLRLDPQEYVITGEDPEEFRELAASMEASYKPFDVRERFLVEQLIIDAWRLRRYERIQPQVKAAGSEKDFDRLQRLIGDIKRSQRRSMAELKRVQTARAKEARRPAAKGQPFDESLPPFYYVN